MELNQYILLIFQRIADVGPIVKIKTFIITTDHLKNIKIEMKVAAHPRQFSFFLL